MTNERAEGPPGGRVAGDEGARSISEGSGTGLDPLIHQSTRLRLIASLARNRELTFGALREALDLTEGNLGAHLARLQEAGYAEPRAVLAGVAFEQRWRLTARGEDAWRAYLVKLRALLQDSEAP